MPKQHCSTIRTIPRGGNWFRRGSAVIEGAFVLIVLLALSFGTIEFGYFFFVKHTVEGAAREGARAAIPANASNTDVTTAIANAMNAAGLQESKSHYTVSISSSSSAVPPTQSNITSIAEGQPVYVTVQCNWSSVGLGLGIIPQSKVVKSISVMRKEGS
jgi:Flp pilus assembly protein TadG